MSGFAGTKTLLLSWKSSAETSLTLLGTASVAVNTASAQAALAIAASGPLREMIAWLSGTGSGAVLGTAQSYVAMSGDQMKMSREKLVAAHEKIITARAAMQRVATCAETYLEQLP